MSARYQIKQSSAYTLIEILVALTIVGLLFNFGYVSFRDFSRRQVVAGVSKQIQGDLRLAQSNALSEQKPLGCNTTLNSYSFSVESASRYTIKADCGASEIIVKDVNLPTDVLVSTPSPNPLQFKVLGQGTDLGVNDWVLTLTQTGTENVGNVTVTSGGEIK